MTLPPPVPMRPHRGTMILVLGILGLACCGVLAIIAWVLGNNDLREMDAGRMDPAGRGVTNAGRILGMIAVGLWVFWVVMAILGAIPAPWSVAPAFD